MTLKLIYIASPYTGDEEKNTIKQIKIADRLRKFGFIPYWPLCTHFWNNVIHHDYEYWMKLDFEMIEQCDAVFRIGGASNGADREVEHAKKCGIPVFTKIGNLRKAKWMHDQEEEFLAKKRGEL